MGVVSVGAKLIAEKVQGLEHNKSSLRNSSP